jgi:hypothetical protein
MNAGHFKRDRAPRGTIWHHECQDFELAISVGSDGRSKVDRGVVGRRHHIEYRSVCVVPRRLAEVYAAYGQVRFVPLPVKNESFRVAQFWHKRASTGIKVADGCEE